jgi:hypothetical protein
MSDFGMLLLFYYSVGLIQMGFQKAKIKGFLA